MKAESEPQARRRPPRPHQLLCGREAALGHWDGRTLAVLPPVLFHKSVAQVRYQGVGVVRHRRPALPAGGGRHLVYEERHTGQHGHVDHSGSIYHPWGNDVAPDVQVVGRYDSLDGPPHGHQHAAHHGHYPGQQHACPATIEVAAQQQPASGQPHSHRQQQHASEVTPVVQMLRQAREWHLCLAWDAPMLLLAASPEPTTAPYTHHCRCPPATTRHTEHTAKHLHPLPTAALLTHNLKHQQQQVQSHA
ncbi:hypothetical protein E2C01_005232 [Portunus trituberculatus]|uniref:Uncharacterized protein n=1 Tax=Portunus trituberculatus TaxID=210409 RepID=A0A5B7CYK9_PORTR|nr:hypothetical protein [Portunus trituberculatus]